MEKENWSCYVTVRTDGSNIGALRDVLLPIHDAFLL